MNPIDPPITLRTVAHATVGIRSGPGMEHPLIGHVTADDVMTMLDFQNGYIHIQVNEKGNTGWIFDSATVRIT